MSLELVESFLVRIDADVDPSDFSAVEFEFNGEHCLVESIDDAIRITIDGHSNIAEDIDEAIEIFTDMIGEEKVIADLESDLRRKFSRR